MSDQTSINEESKKKPEAPTLDFKTHDRVRRVRNQAEGSSQETEVVLGKALGTIMEIREETNTSATDRNRDRRYLVKVKWDNGTTSYCGPESLGQA